MSKLLKAQKTSTGQNLLEDLSNYDKSIPYRIAGTELHQLMPIGIRGYLSALTGQYGLQYALGTFLHPATIAQIFASSPKVAGALQYGLGMPGLVTGPVAKAGEVGTLPARIPYEIGKSEQERQGRASGGRISYEDEADRLVRAAETAKKRINSHTEALLDQPDETIAKRHI